ncbi:MAG: urea transporter [Terriglobales bacterium]
MLRGIGQVMLQNSVWSGLLFLLGIFYSSWVYGIAVLVGTVASTLTGMLFRADPARVRDGLYGFNGALVGVALALFLHAGVATWILIVVASASSAVLMAAMSGWLQARSLSPLTAPFVLTTFGCLPAYTLFGQLQPTQLLRTAGLPKATHVIGTVAVATVSGGIFSGIAQVFLQASAITGILFAIGILIHSRRAFAWAIFGSGIGMLVAWGLGAAEPAIRAGLFGFNSVLTAIAVGSVRLTSTAATAIYVLLASAVTCIAYAALSGILQPAGLSPLTLPFVLVTWVFLSAAHSLPSGRNAGSESPGRDRSARVG